MTDNVSMKTFAQNLALLLARLTLGLSFALAGYVVLKNGSNNPFKLEFCPEWLPANVFDAYGKTLPWLEVGIGILLVLGLFTRVAGILLFVLVAFHCATAFSTDASPHNTFLHGATLATFGLVLALTGGGAWALEERLGGGGKSSGGSEKPAKSAK